LRKPKLSAIKGSSAPEKEEEEEEEEEVCLCACVRGRER
jgi:hypothetical protein